MPLTEGTRLGPYKVIAAIGAGGMGEVYKAKDTRLDRTVAIKVLPSHLADNPDLKQRFEREARAVSSLNHPHICTLHDVGEQDGVDFLVMEYIEGETLADRLKKGALPLDQALRYGIEIADALDKAHRQGVVHRDLKPGNIMLTKSGAKLLDFGLAKLKTSEPGREGSVLSALPTEEKPLTEKGSILGTFQYMAPEQLEGKDADARTDIFAFGVVLFEMLTGRKAFKGKSQASLIGAIMEHDPPPVSQIKAMSPPALDHVVKTCLAKDPDERWQSAYDLMRELKWVAGSQLEVSESMARQPSRSLLVWGLVLGLMVGAVAGIVVWNAMRPSAPRLVSRSVIQTPPSQKIGLGLVGMRSSPFALSADGSRLVYIAENDGISQLYIRSLDQFEAMPISGTEGAFQPFFSPDGQWVGFFTQKGLQRVPVGGGNPLMICDMVDYPWGASWGTDDRIVFGAGSHGLIRVPSSGGEPEVLTVPDAERGEVEFQAPQILPRSKDVLFTVRTEEDFVIAVLSLETSERRILLRGSEGSLHARYLPSGHLVYALSGSLLAVPFDPVRSEISGSSITVVDSVFKSPMVGTEYFTVSDTGSLVYLAGNAASSRETLVWVDREGRETPILDGTGSFLYPVLSPDGRQLAVTIPSTKGGDIWILDVKRGTRKRLTFDEDDSGLPAWTPDGTRIAFSADRGIEWIPVDGSGGAELLLAREYNLLPSSWSPDGRLLAFYEVAPTTSRDIWVLPIEGDRSPTPVLVTEFTEHSAVFSPDGLWLAYVSDERGRSDVYVQPYPGPGAKHLISRKGGANPLWSTDGREIFYRHGDQVLAVAVETEPELTVATPKVLFEGRYRRGGENTRIYNYDVAPDGSRFLMMKSEQDSEPTEFQIVLNWSEELKRLVPTEN